MQKFITHSILICCFLLPIHAAAAIPTGTELQTAAAARRAARLAEQGQTAEPETKETRIRRPLTTTPLHTPESRAAARKAARLKLTTLREAQAKKVTDTTVAPEEIPDLKEQVLALTNAERKKEGLGPLKRNSRLDLAAQAHVLDMQRREFFSHTNPDGLQPTDRIKKTGYLDITIENCACSGWRYAVGENIAKGQQTPEEAVRDWMASPPHRAAILSPEYTEIGIGIIGDLWAQNFGSIKIRK